MRANIKVGDRVKVCFDIELYPFTIVREGGEGVVVDIYQGGYEQVVDVKLDKHDEALDEWDNIVSMSADDKTEKPWFNFHFEVLKEG